MATFLHGINIDFSQQNGTNSNHNESIKSKILVENGDIEYPYNDLCYNILSISW